MWDRHAGKGLRNMSATEKESGIIQAHIRAIEKVARLKKCFIMVRPVNTHATELIRDGCAVKGLEISGKSSNWGPMAGYIPYDERLSKSGSGDGKTKNTTTNDKSIEKHGEVTKVPLKITSKRVTDLKKKGNKFIPTGTTVGEAFKTSRSTSTVFKLEPADGGKYAVLYKAPGMNGFQPVEAMAYSDGRAVTADYDLFAVCPHYTVATPNETKTKETALTGTLSQFQRGVIESINQGCRGKSPTSNPVVRHGTELSNTKKPQDDEFVTLFTPAATSRIVKQIHSAKRGKLFADLVKRGFHIYVNKKWHPRIGSSFRVVKEEAKAMHVTEHKMRTSLSPQWKGHLEFLKNPDFNGLDLPNDKGVDFVKLYFDNMQVVKQKLFQPQFPKK